MGDPYVVQSFDRLIATINHGDDNDEATTKMRDLVKRLGSMVEEHGGTHKGSIALTVAMTADAKGVDIAIKTEAKLPPRPVTKERLFINADNNLTLQDPARDSMFPGADLGRRGRAAE